MYAQQYSAYAQQFALYAQYCAQQGAIETAKAQYEEAKKKREEEMAKAIRKAKKKGKPVPVGYGRKIEVESVGRKIEVESWKVGIFRDHSSFANARRKLWGGRDRNCVLCSLGVFWGSDENDFVPALF